MTREYQADLILRAVSQVAHIEQDQSRADRTRARCRELQARLAARRDEPTHRRFEPLLVAGFSLVYLTALFGNLLRWKGML